MNRKYGLRFSRSQFNRLVRNPVYAGYVNVPAEKDEPAERVKGIHQPLVSEFLFAQVQDIISGRARSTKKVKTNPYFPLRGFLKCPCCGRLLTGSVSKGKTGVYAYYHCREGKVRVAVADVETAFYRYLGKMLPNPEVLELYGATLKQMFLLQETSRQLDIQKNNAEIERYKQKIVAAMDEFTDRRISAEDYREMKSLYRNSIERIEKDNDRIGTC